MEQWESYQSSVFLCHQALGNKIDFAIISAQNPRGHLYSKQYNLRLDYQFEIQLKQLHFPYRRLIGASPDLLFQELSWAVLCDKAAAISLARRFLQNAIYWVQAGELYLVPVLLPYAEVHLGAYQHRQKVLVG